MFEPDAGIMDEPHEVASRIRSNRTEKCEPFTLAECRDKITNGAVGLWDKHHDIKNTMDDPTEVSLLEQAWLGLEERMYGNWHNKVEAKIVEDFAKENRRGPRAINFGSAHQRICDYRMFGPFVKAHFKEGKLFQHTTGGTPMHKIGDLIHSQFKAWEDQVGKGNVRAAMVTQKVGTTPCTRS